MDFATFIHMGGYALNVWGAYGLALAGYGALLAVALVGYERLKKQDREK
jgi:heme exporter protein CcmD